MLKVIQPGIQAVVEDWPGRLGYMGKGMAASGAMDNRALQFGNLLVGNPVNEAGIEITVGLFQAQFEQDAVIAITGCDIQPTINNESVPLWESFQVEAGDIIRCGSFGTAPGGFRTYIAVAGGIDVPVYLGSKSTCLFGNYGGFEGRPLQKDDVLQFGPVADLASRVGRRLKDEVIPEYPHQIPLRVIVGMNAYPDFVSAEGMEFFFDNVFDLTVNSDRSACRLSPVPDNFFSRDSGGVGGSHPSNIVDHAYNMRGAINITGNTPSILIADGPTLGGYIVCANIINADLWRVGQGVPGKDKIKFIQVDLETAIEERKRQRALFTEESLA